MGLAVYEPNSSGLSSPLHEHRGEEHGFVLEGELEMRIGEETVTLRAGDSYSFDARIPHQSMGKDPLTSWPDPCCRAHAREPRA